MVTIYRVIDLSPPHASQEFAADAPADALRLFGVDPVGATEDVLSTRVSQFSLAGLILWLVVALRTQE